MNREEVAMVGFEIVAYAGEARSQLIEALDLAEKGEFDKAESLVETAGKTLTEAHKSQTDMLAKEASGEDLPIGFIMIHGQDHLMTALLLKDMVSRFIELYKRTEGK